MVKLGELVTDAQKIELNQPYNGMNTMAVTEIPMSKIALSRNSRLSVSDGDLSDLMSSLKSVGMLQPIGVIKNGTGYRICYGNRRYLAASKLGWTKVPAIIHESKNAYDADIKNLTENIQRRNISLAEAGRYISILQKEGLTAKECAARLGVSVNYVASCISAFQVVPKEFRDDLEVRVSAKKVSPGKIPVSTAQSIISAQKSYGLSRSEMTLMFRAAKSSDKFKPENVNKYAKAIKSGEKDFIESVKPIRRVQCAFLISETEYARLHREFIDDGPFNSLNALFGAILSGKKATRVKLENN